MGTGSGDNGGAVREDGFDLLRRPTHWYAEPPVRRGLCCKGKGENRISSNETTVGMDEPNRIEVGHVEIRCPESFPYRASVVIDGKEVQECRKVTMVIEVGCVNVVILELVPERVDVDVMARVREVREEKTAGTLASNAATDNSG